MSCLPDEEAARASHAEGFLKDGLIVDGAVQMRLLTTLSCSRRPSLQGLADALYAFVEWQAANLWRDDRALMSTEDYDALCVEKLIEFGVFPP